MKKRGKTEKECAAREMLEIFVDVIPENHSTTTSDTGEYSVMGKNSQKSCEGNTWHSHSPASRSARAADIRRLQSPKSGELTHSYFPG